MQKVIPQRPPVISRGKLPLLVLVDSLPSFGSISRVPISPSLRCRKISRLSSTCRTLRAQASNVGIGSGGYEGRDEKEDHKSFVPSSDSSSEVVKPPSQIPYPISVALVLLGCAAVFSLISFAKFGPSSFLSAIAKSGLTAAFSLIFVSEIGDKTFFIAALLAMQYEKGLVLLGSMGALSLMTIFSVIIGRIFQSVPAQFQTTLPLGEYAAIALLVFFGLKSIKDAWDLPPAVAKEGGERGPELDEFAEAEELVKEQASKRLSNPLEIVWKSFSLVFFAEWGDRSMLATIALGAAQSPWGVASGAIAGHLLATSIAIVGGAFLANYISEKLLAQLFDSSVGITGQVELAELDGPFVKISLKGRFWHKRSTVVARVGNYLKQRIPEILEVDIEDEKQLDDSPASF
ncbi:hypothetical protein CCACVL1_03860 [Corchorus capsularis]|uniref:GDT1 family protein n=1 Tax=Corchorus capsularis TaxID=210143 RepID=A0A1R3JWT2_COCAP|nr:hypothetical protein CCACVL1_03860 [Corchorus capsularis]